MVAATVAALVIVVRLAGCSRVLLLIDLSSSAWNTAVGRRNGFFFARCSHSYDKTESKDGQDGGEMSHTRGFSISKLLRLIDPKSCNISRKCSRAFPPAKFRKYPSRLTILIGGSWSQLAARKSFFWEPENIISLRPAYCIILLRAPFWF